MYMSVRFVPLWSAANAISHFQLLVTQVSGKWLLSDPVPTHLLQGGQPRIVRVSRKVLSVLAVVIFLIFLNFVSTEFCQANIVMLMLSWFFLLHNVCSNFHSSKDYFVASYTSLQTKSPHLYGIEITSSLSLSRSRHSLGAHHCKP